MEPGTAHTPKANGTRVRGTASTIQIEGSVEFRSVDSAKRSPYHAQMDPSDLLPGLGPMLKEHMRPNKEPKDLPFWMVLGMCIAVWAFLMLLPIEAIVAIASQFNGIFGGTHIVETLLIFLLGFAVWLPLFILAQVVAARLGSASSRRMKEELQRERQHNWRQYRTYINTLHSITVELRQQGVKLSTVMLDDAMTKLTAELAEEEADG